MFTLENRLCMCTYAREIRFINKTHHKINVYLILLAYPECLPFSQHFVVMRRVRERERKRELTAYARQLITILLSSCNLHDTMLLSRFEGIASASPHLACCTYVRGTSMTCSSHLIQPACRQSASKRRTR